MDGLDSEWDHLITKDIFCSHFDGNQLNLTLPAPTKNKSIEQIDIMKDYMQWTGRKIGGISKESGDI
jgi:hypothetical protein